MSRVNSRFRLRIIIGVLALGCLVWVSSDQYDIPAETIAWMFVYTFAAMLAIIGFAAAFAGIWIFIRKLIKRD